jgi:photosystem II protein
MPIEVEIFSEQKEESFPIIKLTKSINGKTGTATFLFIQPTSLETCILKQIPIESVCLIQNDKKIQTKDVSICFKKGKPFSVKAIFLFKNSYEWFDFLNFMSHYSKEKGFFFESKNFFNEND